MFIPEPPTKQEWKMYFIRFSVIVAIALIVLFVINKPLVSKSILKNVDKIELTIPNGIKSGHINMSDGSYLQYRFDAGNVYKKVKGDKYFDDYINTLSKLKRRVSNGKLNNVEFVLKLYYGGNVLTIEYGNNLVQIDGKNYTLFNSAKIPIYLFAE